MTGEVKFPVAFFVSEPIEAADDTESARGPVATRGEAGATTRGDVMLFDSAPTTAEDCPLSVLLFVSSIEVRRTDFGAVDRISSEAAADGAGPSDPLRTGPRTEEGFG